MSVLYVVLVYAVWSSVFSLGKLALLTSPPLFLTASRMLLGGVVLLGVQALFQRTSFKISAKQFFSLLILGFFSIYLTNACEFWGLQKLSASKACFIYSLSPFFSALFSYIHFGEKMTSRKWLGMLVGFFGVISILAVQNSGQGIVDGLFFFSYSELALIVAALSSVYGWVLLRLLVKDNAVTPIMANGTSMLLGGLMALAHSMLVDTWNPFPVAAANAIPFLQGIAIITLISNIICYNAYGFLLKRFTATFLSFMGLLSPIFASINGWIFLGEIPHPLIFVGTAIVSFGLWLVYSAELRQGYILKKQPT